MSTVERKPAAPPPKMASRKPRAACFPTRPNDSPNPSIRENDAAGHEALTPSIWRKAFPIFQPLRKSRKRRRAAIAADDNQYAITWGAKPLRDAIVEKFARTPGGHRPIPSVKSRFAGAQTEAMMSGDDGPSINLRRRGG